MEKRLYLKPWIQKTLEVITIFQLMFAVSIDDFEWRAFPFILLHWALMLLNIYILTKYRREDNDR